MLLQHRLRQQNNDWRGGGVMQKGIQYHRNTRVELHGEPAVGPAGVVREPQKGRGGPEMELENGAHQRLPENTRMAGIGWLRNDGAALLRKQEIKP